jgi:hypothetical protein
VTLDGPDGLLDDSTPYLTIVRDNTFAPARPLGLGPTEPPLKGFHTILQAGVDIVCLRQMFGPEVKAKGDFMPVVFCELYLRILPFFRNSIADITSPFSARRLVLRNSNLQCPIRLWNYTSL